MWTKGKCYASLWELGIFLVIIKSMMVLLGFLLLNFTIFVNSFTQILLTCLCTCRVLFIFLASGENSLYSLSCKLVLGVIHEDPDQIRFFLSLSQSIVFDCVSSLLETFPLKPEFHLFLSGKPVLWIGRLESTPEPLIFLFLLLSVFVSIPSECYSLRSPSDCLPAAEPQPSFSLLVLY